MAVDLLRAKKKTIRAEATTQKDEMDDANREYPVYLYAAKYTGFFHHEHAIKGTKIWPANSKKLLRVL